MNESQHGIRNTNKKMVAGSWQNPVDPLIIGSGIHRVVAGIVPTTTRWVPSMTSSALK